MQLLALSLMVLAGGYVLISVDRAARDYLKAISDYQHAVEMVLHRLKG